MGGRIEGKWRANNVFPEPGGPTSSTLWPPAAAISKARLACSCPAMSLKSQLLTVADRGCAGGVTVELSPSSARCSNERLPAATRESPCTNIASRMLASGTTNSNLAFFAKRAIGNAPGMGRIAPSSDSSPAKTRPTIADAFSCPEATKSPTAMGKSKPDPSLRKSAGAKLTVIRRIGISKPQFFIAARTRSRASRTAVSGKPTMSKAGSPSATSTSTSTR